MAKHKRSECPYLHVKDCPGCGRSCSCYRSDGPTLAHLKEIEADRRANRKGSSKIIELKIQPRPLPENIPFIVRRKDVPQLVKALRFAEILARDSHSHFYRSLPALQRIIAHVKEVTDAVNSIRK
jgi:hypothetical protein